MAGGASSVTGSSHLVGTPSDVPRRCIRRAEAGQGPGGIHLRDGVPEAADETDVAGAAPGVDPISERAAIEEHTLPLMPPPGARTGREQ